MPSPFVSRDDLSDKLGIDVSASDKALICVDAACDTIRHITGQDINVTNGGTAILDGTGTDALPLPQRPVLNAGTVIESGGTLVLGTDYKLGANGVLYRLPGVIDNGWGDSQLRTYWWPGRQNIVVTYSHGHTDVPAAIRGVALELAARLYSQGPGVVFESLGQRSVRWDKAASELTNTEKAILENLKR